MFINVLNISASPCILVSGGLQDVSSLFHLLLKDWIAQETQGLALLLLLWL